MLLDSSLNISSFGESEEGELYVADLVGALYRMTAPSPLNVDLTGSWDTLSSTCHITSASPRCLVQGRFLLRNQETRSSLRRALTKFYLSQDEILSPDDRELRQQPTGKIAAGMTVALSFRKSLPFGDTALKQFVIAVVDAEHTIAETDENNNIIAFGLIH